MDLGSLETLVNDTLIGVMSVSAIITRPSPSDTPVTVPVIWLTPTTDDDLTGFDLQSRSARRVIAVRVADLASLPRGSEVLAPLSASGAVLRWRVDGVDRVEDTIRRYMVVPDPDPNTTAPEL